MTKDKEIKKIVPPLRFPEFRNSEGWENTTLNIISNRITNKVGNLELPPVSISAGIGFVTQTEKFGRNISGEQYKNYVILNYGDFAYNKGNSKRYPQGCIYKLTEFNKVAAPNAFICFRFKDNVVPDFYKGYFENNYHGKQLQKFITSSARSDGLLNINPKDFFDIKLPTPKDSVEQQRIADCLGSLDDLINAVTDKIEALKEHKKGLMQQLFPTEGQTTPTLRFPEFQNKKEWENVRLGDYIEIKGRIGYRGYTTNDIVNKGEGAISLSPSNIVSNGELTFEKSTYISWEKYEESPEIMLQEGYTVLVKTGSSYGKSALIKNIPIKSTINPQLVVLKPRNINSEFLFLIVINTSVQKQINEKVVGGAIPTLSQDSISKFIVLLPLTTEQQKIADCLSSVDELISAESSKLNQLKAHKRGLMQQLFPSTDDI